MKGGFTDQMHIMSASPHPPALNKNPACMRVSVYFAHFCEDRGAFCLSFTT